MMYKQRTRCSFLDGCGAKKVRELCDVTQNRNTADDGMRKGERERERERERVGYRKDMDQIMEACNIY
jgi:hypothetical protein